jgi:hypothetical protein
MLFESLKDPHPSSLPKQDREQENPSHSFFLPLKKGVGG